MLSIHSIHVVLAFAGRNHVLGNLRETCWLIHAYATVRSMISMCITCRKLRNKYKRWPIYHQIYAFTYTGVHLFGPLMIKQDRKE